MSDQAASAEPRIMGAMVRWAITFAIVFAIIAVFLGPAGLAYVGRTVAGSRLHAPNLVLIAEAPLVIQLHLATVLLGFGIGTIQMLAPKGTVPHRALGWVFVLFMLFTALDALFIKSGPTWRVTPIQLFSVFVLVSLPLSVLAARRHNVRAHARGMTGLYFGGLILAGFFTLIPGRLLWRVFFG
jgi:uncharacterized membrane protein